MFLHMYGKSWIETSYKDEKQTAQVTKGMGTWLFVRKKFHTENFKQYLKEFPKIKPDEIPV